MGKRNNRKGKILGAVSVLLCLFLVLFLSPFKIPENPLDGNRNNIFKELQSRKEVIAEKDALSAERETSSFAPDSSENSSRKQNSAEGEQTNRDTDGANNSRNGGTENTGKDGGGRAPTAEALEMVAGDRNENQYFTTSITDGETVTQAEYPFTITHLQKKLTVRRTLIYVNDKSTGAYRGAVTLPEKENHICIQVTYGKQNGESLTVKRTYVVYLDTENIVITTDLQNNSVYYTSACSFTAYGKYRGKTLSVEITADKGIQLRSQKNRFTAELKQGENTFSITCSYQGKHAGLIRTVHYQQSREALVIDTNLSDQTVSVKNYSFYAVGYRGSRRLDTKVTWNQKELKAADNDTYEASLQEGENVFKVTASDGEQTVTKTYTVTYTKKSSEDGTVPENPRAPEIFCSLKSGSTVKNKTLVFSVSGKDYQGKWLDQSYFRVSCSGKKASMIYANINQISYSVKLSSGYNTIVIVLADRDGNEAQESYSIRYTPPSDGIVGTATISVEATTIGCGYLIPPTEVAIRENRPASWQVAELLEKNGFRYESGGTVDSGFYLNRILADWDFVTPAVPSDLEALLKEEDKGYPGSYETDSLGEFDLATGSGWMYSINGKYPNYALSDCYLQDGDVLRIRFSLHYGADIGGADSWGNGGNSGDADNWGKEW